MNACIPNMFLLRKVVKNEHSCDLTSEVRVLTVIGGWLTFLPVTNDVLSLTMCFCT